MRVRLSLDVQGSFRVDLNELPEASPQQVSRYDWQRMQSIVGPIP